MAFYTIHCFLGVGAGREDERGGVFIFQTLFLLILHTLGFAVLHFRMDDPDALFYCALQNVMILGFIVLMRILYPYCSRLLMNNMLLFLSTGLLMLYRLNRGDHLRQLIIAVVSLILILPIPALVKNSKAVERLKSVSSGLGVSGVMILSAVLVLGRVTRGSRLSVSIGGVAFQPSEIVKNLFILCLSGIYSLDCFSGDDLSEDSLSGEEGEKGRSRLIYTAAAALLAAAHMLILVLSKDLGGALIFFMIYASLTFIALKKPWLPAVFAGAGFLSCIAGYKLFSHVRKRFLAWRDPFTYIDDQGYQITQSLFAIGTGSWFGMGLYEGSPDKIPIVGRDFIFAAISEELGCIFSLCLILVIISTFLILINTAILCKDKYLSLVASGISVCYAFQTFLNIGGVTRFIPLTGVTLPLVSYGGSSLLSTLIMFALIQGIIVYGRE